MILSDCKSKNIEKSGILFSSVDSFPFQINEQDLNLVTMYIFFNVLIASLVFSSVSVLLKLTCLNVNFYSIAILKVNILFEIKQILSTVSTKNEKNMIHVYLL